MKILVINPNTTASMTEKIFAGAQAAAGPATTVVARNPARGPASIQGPKDGKDALPGVLDLVDDMKDQGFDCVVIACFDDTGLEEVRVRSGLPTIGIGQAAFHIAALMSEKFSVVTTLPISIPVIEDNLHRYGFATSCSRVRASNVPVLDLEDELSNARLLIEAEISAAAVDDGISAVVLGCAGMTDLARDLSKKYGIPVVDGVAAAVRLAEATFAIRYALQ